MEFIKSVKFWLKLMLEVVPVCKDIKTMRSIEFSKKQYPRMFEVHSIKLWSSYCL